jgi:hypothetical protein
LIPKKATGGTIKYDFDSMTIGKDFIKADNYGHARSIRVCAVLRKYKASIRTVGSEVRVYLTGRR